MGDTVKELLNDTPWSAIQDLVFVKGFIPPSSLSKSSARMTKMFGFALITSFNPTRQRIRYRETFKPS